ncbi:MAG: copper homeostasis protein CutC, partial [Flavobacteriales bacterium]
MNFEICVSTPVDVALAQEAGADRVELCGHWECGG